MFENLEEKKNKSFEKLKQIKHCYRIKEASLPMIEGGENVWTKKKKNKQYGGQNFGDFLLSCPQQLT